MRAHQSALCRGQRRRIDCGGGVGVPFRGRCRLCSVRLQADLSRVGIDGPFVTRGRPRQPSHAPPRPIAARICRDGKQPGFQIAGIAAVLQVVQQLEERLLHDVLGISGVAQHAAAEAIQRGAVFLKQPQRLGLRIDGGRRRGKRWVSGLHPATRNRSHIGSRPVERRQSPFVTPVGRRRATRCRTSRALIPSSSRSETRCSPRVILAGGARS